MTRHRQHIIAYASRVPTPAPTPATTLESESVAESVATVAMLKYAPAGRNRSASDVSRFRLSSVKLRNHKVGYFDPLLWAVRVTIIVETFCIGGK